MKKIVLIDGVDTFQTVGAPTMHLGRPNMVEDEVAKRLLSLRCQSGPMFVEFSELDHRRVPIRLVDPTRDFRNAAICAMGRQVIEVSASIAPYLLRMKKDGSQVFESVANE